MTVTICDNHRFNHDIDLIITLIIYLVSRHNEKYMTIGDSHRINHYFPFQPVVHNWFIKGCGMYCSVYGKVHIKDPLLRIEKSSLCGGSGFPSKKCVNVTI